MADTELRLVEQAVMDVVLSREGRRRYNKGDSLTLDPSDLREIVRLTMAKCITSPSPSTAPEVGERAAFEAWIAEAHMPHIEGEEWPVIEVKKAWLVWQAALASRPAEVDDEGPRLLPRHVFKSDELYEEYLGEVTGWYPITNSLEFGGIKKTDEEGLPPLPEPRAIRAGHGFPKVYALAYTAEQYRQGQRDAVAADRAKVPVSELLAEIQSAIDTLDQTELENRFYVPIVNTLHHCRDAFKGAGFYGGYRAAPSHTTNKEN